MIRYDVGILTCAQKLTSSQLNLAHGNKKNIQSNEKKLKTKKLRSDMLIKTGSDRKPVKSVLRNGERVYGGKDL